MNPICDYMTGMGTIHEYRYFARKKYELREKKKLLSQRREELCWDDKGILTELCYTKTELNQVEYSIYGTLKLMCKKEEER